MKFMLNDCIIEHMPERGYLVTKRIYGLARIGT